MLSSCLFKEPVPREPAEGSAPWARWPGECYGGAGASAGAWEANVQRQAARKGNCFRPASGSRGLRFWPPPPPPLFWREAATWSDPLGQALGVQDQEE